MKLKEMITGLDFELICGDLDTDVVDITNDSRKVVKNGLYFAIPGAKVDGAKFIPDVIRAGADVIVTEKDVKQLSVNIENDM